VVEQRIRDKDKRSIKIIKEKSIIKFKEKLLKEYGIK